MTPQAAQQISLLSNPTLACQSEVDLLRRRERVAALRNQGWCVADIAQELGVDPGTVSRDIKAVCNYYRARIAQHRNVWIADALEKLDYTEREAWEAFRRSTGVVTERTRETSGKGVKRRVTKKEKAGDPRFMAIAVNCQKQRSMLLGLLTKEQGKEIGRIDLRRPKILVIRDRQQVADLIDVSEVETLEVVAPNSKPTAGPDDETGEG